MSLKNEWKETGKGLGNAFSGLGKNIGRSAKAGIDAATGDTPDPNNTVFNDGSWRQTGKNIGGAFAGLGKSIVHSVKHGVDSVDHAINNNDNPADSQENTVEAEYTVIDD